MGKYIRNSKIDRESESTTTALMDGVSSPLGVLTRAKSLALQQQQQQQQRRLQKPSSSSVPTPTNPPSKQKTTDCGGSYLQLRSRRLQKKPPIVLIRRNRRKETCAGRNNPNPQIRGDGSISRSRSRSRSDSVAESGVCGKVKGLNCEINKDLCIDTSFGENLLELEDATESFNRRTTRESTPCSLIRKPETTPGSSTKVNDRISDNSNRREEGRNRHLPTTPEMDEFFSGAEEEQQKQFIEKYNFDPVNEQPLPGRYEWKKVED